MSDTGIAIIAIGIFVGMVTLIWWTNRNRIQAKSKMGDVARGGPMAERVTGIDQQNRLTMRPSGLQIWYDPGTSHTGPETTLIQQAVQDCFEKARVQGHTKALNIGEYIVAVLKSERSPVRQEWSFEVPDLGGEYNDTEFDQAGSHILANEAVANYGGRLGNIVCVADAHGATNDKDREALYNATMAGVEHVVLYFNDPAEYERTKIHREGGHPLF